MRNEKISKGKVKIRDEKIICRTCNRQLEYIAAEESISVYSKLSIRDDANDYGDVDIEWEREEESPNDGAYFFCPKCGSYINLSIDDIEDLLIMIDRREYAVFRDDTGHKVFNPD